VKARISRLRHRGQPRPLVPGPGGHGHPHARFEADSRAVWFEGNYAGYEADEVRRRLGPEAARSHRVTYRKLVRR
jgi:hypothetical protein